ALSGSDQHSDACHGLLLAPDVRWNSRVSRCRAAFPPRSGDPAPSWPRAQPTGAWGSRTGPGPHRPACPGTGVDHLEHERPDPSDQDIPPMPRTPTHVPGIHHVTAIAGRPGPSVAFYANALGLR